MMFLSSLTQSRHVNKNKSQNSQIKSRQQIEHILIEKYKKISDEKCTWSDKLQSVRWCKYWQIQPGMLVTDQFFHIGGEG